MTTGKKKQNSKKKKKSGAAAAPKPIERSDPKETEAILRNAAVLSSLNDLRSSLPSPVRGAVSHYTAKDQPGDIAEALSLMVRGADVVHGTATKFSLVSKASIGDSAGLSEDILRGSQYICTALVVLCEDHDPIVTDTTSQPAIGGGGGCDLPLQKYLHDATASVLTASASLVGAFASSDFDAPALNLTSKGDNQAAQLTGVVWSACDGLRKTCPTNNRTAYRRHLFRVAGDVNATIEEFTQMLDQGVREEDEKNGEVPDEDEGDDDDDGWDDFCAGDEDFLYSEVELDVARAAVGLAKCSRGAMNVALASIDAAGMKAVTCDDVTIKENLLAWASAVFSAAEKIGTNVTDFGSLLYPPLEIISEGEEGECALVLALQSQHDALISFFSVVICDENDDDKEWIGFHEDLFFKIKDRRNLEFELPDATSELAKKLSLATKTRLKEALEGILKIR